MSAKDLVPDFPFPARLQRTPIDEVSIVLDRLTAFFERKSKERQDFWNETFEKLWNDPEIDEDDYAFWIQQELKEIEKKQQPDFFQAASLIMMGCAYTAWAYCVQATKSQQAKEEAMAWGYACDANRWLGLAEASEIALENYQGLIEGTATTFARKGAMAHHAENHAMRRDIWEWFAKEGSKYKSKSKAADAAFEAKLAPVTHRTLYEWLRQYKPDLPPASKP